MGKILGKGEMGPIITDRAIIGGREEIWIVVVMLMREVGVARAVSIEEIEEAEEEGAEEAEEGISIIMIDNPIQEKDLITIMNIEEKNSKRISTEEDNKIIIGKVKEEAITGNLQYYLGIIMREITTITDKEGRESLIHASNANK